MCPRSRIGERSSKLPIFLRPDQVTELLSVPTRLRDRLLLRLLYFLALRVSEALDLRFEDVDPVERMVKICHARTPSGLPKGRKERFVPIDPETLRLIVDYAGTRNRGPLFTIGVRLVQRMIKKYAEQAGIPDWKRVTPHKLRHSFAVHWVRCGGDLERLRRILGHESLETTQVYLQFRFKDVREEYDRIMGSEPRRERRPVYY